MRLLWRLAAVAVLPMMLTCAGCAANGALSTQQRAAADLGRAGAGLRLERQPDECGQPIQHIALRAGVEIRSALRRERAQLDRANDRLAACAAYTETLRTSLGGAR